MSAVAVLMSVLALLVACASIVLTLLQYVGDLKPAASKKTEARPADVFK